MLVGTRASRNLWTVGDDCLRTGFISLEGETSAVDDPAQGIQGESCYGCDFSSASLAAGTAFLRHYGRIDSLVFDFRINSYLGNVLKAETAMLRLRKSLKLLFALTQGVIPGMSARKEGNVLILLETTPTAINGAAEAWDYAVFKAAALGFVRALAKEMSGKRVLVNVLLTGPIEPNHEAETTKATAEIETWKTLPLQRPATILELRAALAHLLSGENQYYTGTAISMNGGLDL